jgi:hypothetical protein
MADRQLSASLRDDVPQVRSVIHEGKERTVLRPYGIPVGTVHLGIVEELALHPPRFAEDLSPLDVRIHPRLQLCHVDHAVANLRRLVGGHHAPSRRTTGCLIEDLLSIGRHNVRANAVDEHCGRAVLELISLHT